MAAAEEIGAASTWVLSNHDVMRHATRYGLAKGSAWRKWPVTGPVEALDVELGQRRARAACLITMSLPGSTYVYQGEELGLPEVWDLPEEVLDDPTWERSGHAEKGRDGCRVPIPWTRSGPSFGFGDVEPWLPQPETFGAMSAEAEQGDPSSMLELYRAAIAARKTHLIDDQSFEMLDLGPDVLAYRRGVLQVVVNMGSTPIPLPAGEVLLTSFDSSEALSGGGQLPSDSAVWLAVS